MITVGDIIYDSYPGTPTNGGNNWIALKLGGVGDAYSFQINTVGAVIAVGGSCAGSIVFTVNNPSQFNYPVTAGNGSASGTIKNNTGATIYVYSNFNSGGQSSGTINGDTGTVAGGLALDIPGGPITSGGQNFYSSNYETIPSDNIAYNWSLTKNDTYSTALLRFVYSTTPGGTKNIIYYP